jgi:hypothetical protein
MKKKDIDKVKNKANLYPIKWFKITFAIHEDFPLKEWMEESLRKTVSNLINLHLTGAVNPQTAEVRFAMKNPANQMLYNAESIKRAREMIDKTKKKVKIDWVED